MIGNFGPIWGPNGLGPNPAQVPNQPTPVDWHFNRNNLNFAPRAEPQQGCDGRFRDNLGFEWIKDDDWVADRYHGGYPTYRGTGKFEGSQAVYKNGLLLNGGPFQGTYDFFAPRSADGGLTPGAPFHFGADVLPHDIFGSNYAPTPEQNIY